MRWALAHWRDPNAEDALPYLLALDQGTTSSRAIVFGDDGSIKGSAQQQFRQIYPQPGWVEHDPTEIWGTQLACARVALRNAGVDAADIAALGIANQRETTIIWERDTGTPIHNAIVWQDRRTAQWCAEQRARGLLMAVQAKTGLVLDPYFSASKIAWLLDTIPGARARAEHGELAFGTIDTWLIWNLTGGLHLTDPSNASRTLLYNIHRGAWAPELLEAFGIPASLLPEVRPSAGDFGPCLAQWLGAPVRIAGVAGDQQAALFGQGCHAPGQVKNTYGTGCFMLMHTGAEPVVSSHGLLTTAAAQVAGSVPLALEGSVFSGGSIVQWLRDELHIIDTAAQVEALASTVPDTAGVYLVPAFTGLGSPYWDADARAAVLGITRGTGRGHLARAALEAIALQSAELLIAMKADSRLDFTELRVDGGACVNDLLMQMQADLLGVPVIRPRIQETTAQGVADLAALGAGVWPDAATLVKARSEAGTSRHFEPVASRDWAEHKLQAWRSSVARCLTQRQ